MHCHTTWRNMALFVELSKEFSLFMVSDAAEHFFECVKRWIKDSRDILKTL